MKNVILPVRLVAILFAVYTAGKKTDRDVKIGMSVANFDGGDESLL